MQKIYSLSELLPGQSATVYQILLQGEIKRRLQDLGFIKGCPVSCVFFAASKDPVAYRVRGTLFALRRKDAKNILVKRRREPVEKHKHQSKS